MAGNDAERKSKRGGSRAGAGRRKVTPEQPLTAPTKNLATEILQSLGDPKFKCSCLNSTCEICLWRSYALRDRSALEYLWNRRDGRPVQTVNHVHDKPIEMTVTLSLAEAVQKARKRAGTS